MRELDMIAATGEQVSVGLLAIALMALTRGSVGNVILAITIAEIPRVSRLVRGVVLAAAAAQRFPSALSADIDLAEFVLVDISAEPEDGAPEHSGDSIVRGELQSA